MFIFLYNIDKKRKKVQSQPRKFRKHTEKNCTVLAVGASFGHGTTKKHFKAVLLNFVSAIKTTRHA